MSGLVRARGLKPFAVSRVLCGSLSGLVRARGLKLIRRPGECFHSLSGLVRARGLKLKIAGHITEVEVRARKSPWIETYRHNNRYNAENVRARKSPWIETLK